MIHNSFGSRHPAIWAGVNLQLWNRIVTEKDFTFRMNAATKKQKQKKNTKTNPQALCASLVFRLYFALTTYNSINYMQPRFKNKVNSMKDSLVVTELPLSVSAGVMCTYLVTLLRFLPA